MRFRWLPVSSGYSPPDSLHPAATYAAAVCLPVCIFDFSNRSLSNFRCVRPALVRLNSRPRLASEPTLRPVPLRRSCGPNRLFQALDPLTEISALKLRLERFRTSHARVLGNLLFSEIRAREIRANFVGFLFKSGPSCGVSWKRCRERSGALNVMRNLHSKKAGTAPSVVPTECLSVAQLLASREGCHSTSPQLRDGIPYVLSSFAPPRCR